MNIYHITVWRLKNLKTGRQFFIRGYISPRVGMLELSYSKKARLNWNTSTGLRGKSRYAAEKASRKLFEKYESRKAGEVHGSSVCKNSSRLPAIRESVKWSKNRDEKNTNQSTLGYEQNFYDFRKWKLHQEHTYSKIDVNLKLCRFFLSAANSDASEYRKAGGEG